MLDSDTKDDIYEGILERNVEDVKSGAGQYFTPRALIAAMAECVAPEPGKTIAAYDYLTREGIECYNPANRHKRKETWNADKNPEGRWRKDTCGELAARDKTSLDLFWLKDDSLANLDHLPEPADLVDEIIENIEAGLASFRVVAMTLPAAG